MLTCCPPSGFLLLLLYCDLQPQRHHQEHPERHCVQVGRQTVSD
jgi:hypothetical protein